MEEYENANLHQTECTAGTAAKERIERQRQQKQQLRDQAKLNQGVSRECIELDKFLRRKVKEAGQADPSLKYPSKPTNPTREELRAYEAKRKELGRYFNKQKIIWTRQSCHRL